MMGNGNIDCLIKGDSVLLHMWEVLFPVEMKCEKISAKPDRVMIAVQYRAGSG